MDGSQKRSKLLRRCNSRRLRALVLATAALPLFQATGCYPDLLGAFNYELQSFVNTTAINAIDTIVQNILGL